MHGPVAGAHTAVNAQGDIGVALPIGAHRFPEVAGLVGDALQRGAGEFCRTGVAGEAKHTAPAIGFPIGCAEACKRRHKDYILGGICLIGQHARLAGFADDAQPVAQPLHRSPRDKDRPFQSIGGFAIQLIGNGGQHAIL